MYKHNRIKIILRCKFFMLMIEEYFHSLKFAEARFPISYHKLVKSNTKISVASTFGGSSIIISTSIEDFIGACMCATTQMSCS